MTRHYTTPEPSLETMVYARAINVALRRCGLFLRARGGQRAVGLVLPPEANAHTYKIAAELCIRGSAMLSGYVVTIVFSDAQKSATFGDKARTVLEAKTAVIVLIEHGAEISDEIAVALDRVIDVGPPRPNHVAAAAKAHWQVEIAPDEARQLIAFPAKLMFAALRKGRSISMALEKLTSAQATPEANVRTRWEPKVEDLEGYGAARDWALDLVVDLKGWEAGSIGWRDVDAGLLLSGPPGTGKTLFAAALARSCNATFVPASSARWQAQGHLGDMLKAMRRSFSEAAAAAPSILFIDEFDAIGDRAQFKGNNVDYSSQVVNALLELLDGSDEREGIVVVAATNFSGRIDPAMMRPGRLDRHVRIELPDRAARLKMLAQHLEDALDAGLLEEFAASTSGMSGAELAQVARDARRAARKSGRAVTLDDLRGVLPVVNRVGETELWSLCVHEAGHAVVGLELGVGAIDTVVVARERADKDTTAGHVVWRRKAPRIRMQSSYSAEIAMLLSGMAAEKLVVGDVSDGSGGVQGSDLHRASELATMMVGSLGFGALEYRQFSNTEELDKVRRDDPGLRQRVERMLGAELRRAEGILRRRQDDVIRLATALSMREVMSGDDVMTVLSSGRAMPSS